MKTSTKVAAIKIAAFALLAVFAVMGCTGEVELTSPDWNEYSKQFSSNKIGANSDYFDASDIIFVGNFNYVYPATDQTALDKEIYVIFPNESDFLRSTVTTAVLTPFMTFNTYTTPAKHVDALDSASSALSNVLYEFVRLQPDSTGYTRVYIRLNTVPDTSIIVANIDSTVFTYANGKKLGSGLWKGETGALRYDDGFTEITVTNCINPNPDTFIAPGGYWNGYAMFEINFGTGLFTTGTEQTVTVAEYNGYLTRQTDLDSVMTTLLGKLYLEQYNTATGGWTDVTGNPFSIIKNSGENTNEIELTFTPEDAVAYRVRASGVKYLELGPYDGVTQRVYVTGDTTNYNGNYAFLYETVYSNIRTCRITSTSSYTIPTTTIFSGNRRVQTDAQGKNVVLHYQINAITVTPFGESAGPVYLPSNAPSLDVFNKNFKFIYNKQPNSTTENSIVSLNASTIYSTVKIIKVEYKRSDYTPVTSDIVDEMVITLDPDYRYNPNGRKYLVLAPGFQYSDTTVKFGNYNNLNPIDGTYFLSFFSTILAF